MVSELTMSFTERRLRTRKVVCHLIFLLFLAGVTWPAAGQWALSGKEQKSLGQSRNNWIPLAGDKIHDPRGPSFIELQQPGEGLYELPAHKAGNRVRWAVALDRGAINPRRSVNMNGPEVQVLDMDVLLDINGSFPIVRFSHKIHTQWLSCDNCHDQIFKPLIGVNRISMYQILQGEQCGLCHGSVAFPVTECTLCHSVERPDVNSWRLKKFK